MGITHSYPATHIEKLSRYIDTLAVQEADLNSLSCRRGESLSQATRHISWTTEASIKHTGSQARCGRQQASNALMRGTFLFSVHSVVIVNAGCCLISRYRWSGRAVFLKKKKIIINVMT